ncbi:hypothetical protein C8F01DRAFT_1105262 [Mycena amicta]|nr:hypothetical protein C8F01DRAFT_1105262 [Mycena amicta]
MALTFDALPTDILLQIVSYSETADVLALSMVTKSFHALSADEHKLLNFVLHSRRLARNWSLPRPSVAGPITSLHIGVHNSILYCLPGTSAVVMYSLEEETAICLNTQTGESSPPTMLGRVHDMSSPIEELEGYTVAVLVDNQRILVLKASCSPVPSTEITYKCSLDTGYQHTAIFMNSFAVGVVRADLNGNSGIELQTFSLRDSTLSTVIPSSRTLGSAVVNDTVFLVALQHSQAAVYACPRRFMAGCPSSSPPRSHVGHIPSSSNEPTVPLTRFRDYCVLSTEPYHGRSTISTAEYNDWEKGLYRTMLPTQTITLLVIANSGLAIVLLVDPALEDSTPVPADYNCTSCAFLTVSAKGDFQLSTRNICAVGVDDHRGAVIVVTTSDVLHVIPYA